MSDEAKRLLELLTASEEYGYPADLKTICEELGIEYDESRYKYPSNAPAYRHVWDLVEEINNAMDVDKIVYRAKNYHFRLATRQECIATYVKLRRQAIDYHNRANLLEAKMRRNGQGKTVTNDARPLDESEPPFHSTYAGE